MKSLAIATVVLVTFGRPDRNLEDTSMPHRLRVMYSGLWRDSWTSRLILFIATIVLILLAFQLSLAGLGASTSRCREQSGIDRCLSNTEYVRLREIVRQSDVGSDRSETTVILFEDPVDSGMNSPGRPINNYVDLDPGEGILDYNCGSASYNGHRGIDIEIRDFYDMDEGVPILCAADGVVIVTHDGEFDRHLVAVSGTAANRVVVQHVDGSLASYYHMRKYSLQVQVGDSVEVGDTLGYIGSSGQSTFPHLHFEVFDGIIIEPHNGLCQGNPSRWAFSQIPYIMDLPLVVLTHGLTSINATWRLISERPPSAVHVQSGQPIYSWIKFCSLHSSDSLTWKLYANGNLWNESTFVAGDDYRISWWFTDWMLPTSLSYYGNWRIEIYHNVTLIAEQEFLYDVSANQAPSLTSTTVPVKADSCVSGELAANDLDGEVFWYEVALGPSNGIFTQYGGRKRKFEYVPNGGFVGQDTVEVYAIDNDSLAGTASLYIFDVVATNCCQGIRGDIDGSGAIDIADLTFLVDFMFNGGEVVGCLDEGDLNVSGSIDITDVTYLVDYMFQGGPAPLGC